MKKQVTLKQIAKELQVSISTVSKALKDSHEISQETKEKVLAFAKLYNYRPNFVALSLKNRKTYNIAVIIPEIIHTFFATVIYGIEQEATKRGYNVIVCLSDESWQKEKNNMEMMANGNIDGFILSLAKETQSNNDFNHIQEIIEEGMPVVLFDRVTQEIDCDKVITDDIKASEQAVQALLNMGSKNIGIITTVDYISVGKLRTEGYLNTLIKNGIEIDPELICKIEDINNCQNQIEHFFENKKVDAIFAVNELFAVNVIKIAHNRGIKIPEELKILGFTDGLISKYSTPTISVVSQDEERMGKMAARRLIDRLESEQENQIYTTDVINTRIIYRESTPTL